MHGFFACNCFINQEDIEKSSCQVVGIFLAGLGKYYASVNNYHAHDVTDVASLKLNYKIEGLFLMRYIFYHE